MFDLNIPYATINQNPNIIEKLYELGWKTLAISQELNVKKAQVCNIPITTMINETNKKLVKENSNPNELLKLYSRLNIVMDQEKHNYSTTNHKIMQSYDLVAVKPMTDKLFQLACNQLEVDIIMIDPSSRLRVKQSTINQALRRGITFEISYGPLIRSNESRKQILMNAAELMRKTKGKQTIVTSDLQSVMDMRNPLDIINLCTLLQMNPEIARNAIFENSRYCVLKGIARSKTYRGVLSVQLPDHKRQHSEQDGSNKKIKQSTAFAQAL